MRPDFDLYFITDRSLSKKGVVEDVKAAIRGGVRIVQYREKGKPVNEMIREAKRLAGICRKNGVIFIVNDRVDVAMESGADGVHIGPEDMNLEAARDIMGKGKIIGVTASTLAGAKRLEEAGADYVALSPVFETSTKKDAGKAIGTGVIKKAAGEIKIPVVAIGGINRANLKDVLDAGCGKVCMISAILNAGDVEKEVREMRRIINDPA